MPRDRLDTGGWRRLLHLPQPNPPIKAAAGQQAPIRTPGYRIHRTRMRERLQVRATLEVPEDGGIIPTAGEQASLAGKGQVVGAFRMPAYPEQGATLQIPPLDAAVPAPADQAASIRAEREGRHHVRVGLPDQVQALASLLLPLPHPHFPPLAACG